MATATAIIDRLTPFECYMFAEQNDRQAMSFFLRICLSGPIDVEKLRTSLARAATHHPLLTARVVRGAKKRLYWAEGRASANPLTIDPQCSPPNTEMIHLESSPGLRVWLTGCNREHVLWLEAHHACCDGQALWSFFQTWQKELEPVDAQTNLAVHRGEANGEWHTVAERGVPSLGMLTWRQLRRLTRFSLRRRILPIGDRNVLTVRNRRVLVKEIPLPSCSKFAHAHSGPLATVNDVLIASYFLALGRAVEKAASHTKRDSLRLCIPVNLRQYATRPDVVANCVSMVFLDRRLDQLADTHELLSNVSQEMNYVKRHRIALCMLHVLRVFRGRFRVPPDRCMASAVLSNMGQLTRSDADNWQFGGAQITAVDLLPPLRQHTNIAIGVTSVSNTVRLAMHYNAAAIHESCAAELLNSLANQAQQFFGLSSTAAPDQ